MQARLVMNRTRRSLIAGGLFAVTALTGCFPFIKEDSARQADVMADVKVSTKNCSFSLGRVARAGAFDELCTSKEDALEWHYGSYPDEETLPWPSQVMLSYRVPKGAEVPETVTARADVVRLDDWLEFWDWNGGGTSTNATTTGEGEGEGPAPVPTDITFRRSAELDEQMPALWAGTDDGDPSTIDGVQLLDDGDQLVSYVSDVVPGATVGDYDIEAAFGLPSQKRPYAGPFNHLTMVGARVAVPEGMLDLEDRVERRIGATRGTGWEAYSPDRPIQCGTEPLIPGLDGDVEERSRTMRGIPIDELQICPLPRYERVQTKAEAIKVFDGADTVTRDLDLRGSGETFVEQGNAATVPFGIVGAGPAGGKVDITATVSPAIPGLDPVRHAIDFPGTGTHARSVEIKVPASAPARTYEVLVTASKAGKSRTAKAGLVVLPKPQAPAAAVPAAAAAASKPVGRENVYMDKDGYIRFGSTCGTCAIDGLVPFGSVGTKAQAAQATGKHRLLRVARGKVKGKAGVRRAVKVKLFPKAQRAVRKGRRLTGVIVFRKGASGTPQVRKVVFRTRRK